jgi:hypothetical protein
VTVTNLGLLGADLPAPPIASDSADAGKGVCASHNPVNTSRRKTRLSKISAPSAEVQNALDSSTPVSPPPVKGQASSWSMQTLVEESPASRTSGTHRTDKGPTGAAPVGKAAHLQQQDEVTIGTAVHATPLNTRNANRALTSDPNQAPGPAPAEVVKVGRKRKSTCQLVPGPSESPSPFARRPLRGGAMTGRESGLSGKELGGGLMGDKEI